MYNILKLNKIAAIGTDRLGANYNCVDECDAPEGILVRSAAMHDMELPESLLAVARAGAGVNNIPLDKCAEKGICVFNTPGANANAVKELVLCGMLLASRKVAQGIAWNKTLADDAGCLKTVEKGKSQFVGPEIMGKTLGVVGMGAIGILVANAALALGMKVIGYDPFLSEAGKAKLEGGVIIVDTLDDIYADSDYITLHLPLNDGTRGMINNETIGKMKDGVRILNFARDGLVKSEDIIAALGSGKMAAYVTDFATQDLLTVDGVVAIPHLGASTPESEDNCAVMAADEIKDYLENGNIKNSVNFPNIAKDKTGDKRVTVFGKGIEAAVKAIAADAAVATRGDYTYAIIDGADAEAFKAIDGVIRVREL